jgi:hypothetical protein
MPAQALDAFSAAMADAMLLPPLALLIGLVGVLFFEQSQGRPASVSPVPAPATAAE